MRPREPYDVAALTRSRSRPQDVDTRDRPVQYGMPMVGEARASEGRSGWPGISCLSWMWPHVADGARFEVRRAVASMTHGLRRSSDAAFDLGEPETRELLAVIVAANSIAKAAEATLLEVVSEARARQVTWERIGEILGYGKEETSARKGAQRRFGHLIKGISPVRKETMPIEKTAAQVTFRSILGTLPPDVPLPLDEEDWEAAPPETAVPYAVRNIAGAKLALEKAFKGTLLKILVGEEAGADFIRSAHESYEALRHSSGILASPKAWEAIDSAARELSAPSRMLGEAPVTHFVHAACASTVAFAHFHNFFEPKRNSSKIRSRSLAMADYYLETAVFATVRPECLEILGLLESRAHQAGHVVYRGSPGELSDIDMADFSDAYWRCDATRLADILGNLPGDPWKRQDIMDVVKSVERAESWIGADVPEGGERRLCVRAHLLTGPEPLQLVEAAIAGFLDSDRVGPDARATYDDMADRVTQHSRPRWWAACSLDLPSVLGNGKPPIYCARPGHRFSNSLVALEWNYGGTMSTGFKGKVTGRGQVGEVADGGGYRDSIDDTHPNYYWDTLAVPSSGLAFALNLSEGRNCRWAYKVAEVINGRRTEIRGIVGKQVQGARAEIDTLLTAAKLPAFLLHPVVGLMVTAIQAVAQAVCAALVKTLSDKSLTTWTIWHTAVMSQRKVPISVFTLSLPGADTPGLQYLKPDQDGSTELTASDNYPEYPVFMRQARFMIGESEPPYDQFNDALFDLTDRSAQPPQPLAWREPLETNSGFRILVPHRAPGTKASYVSALRVDVKLEQGPGHYVF
jgi:hypothetical protein